MDFALFTALAGQQGAPVRPAGATSDGASDAAGGFAALVAALAGRRSETATDATGAGATGAGTANGSVGALFDAIASALPDGQQIEARAGTAIADLTEELAAGLRDLLGDLEAALPAELRGDPRLAPDAVLADPLAALGALADRAPDLLRGLAGQQPAVAALATLFEADRQSARTPVATAAPAGPAPGTPDAITVPNASTAAGAPTPPDSPALRAAAPDARAQANAKDRAAPIADRPGPAALPPAQPATASAQTRTPEAAREALRPASETAAATKPTQAVRPAASEIAALLAQTTARQADAPVPAATPTSQTAVPETVPIRRLAILPGQPDAESDGPASRPQSVQGSTAAETTAEVASPRTAPADTQVARLRQTASATPDQPAPANADTARTTATRVAETAAAPAQPAEAAAKPALADPAALAEPGELPRTATEPRAERVAAPTVVLDGGETLAQAQQAPRAPATAAAAAANPATAAAESARAIAPQIANAITAQQAPGRIELQLDPPELGRIEIALEIADQGLRATLSAERATTGDLVRRYGELLMQQLQNAGFADVDLRFADGQARQGGQGSAEPGGASEPLDTVPEAPARLAVRGGSDGLDLRL